MTGRVSSHTRTQTTPEPDGRSGGPDYCDECSRAIQEWVPWPCHVYETDGTTKGVCTLCGEGPHEH